MFSKQGVDLENRGSKGVREIETKIEGFMRKRKMKIKMHVCSFM